MRIEVLPEQLPLEVRSSYLRRRRTDPRRALTTAAVVIAVAWALMIGLGLFLR